jgi:hypothetical protein|tara:strand:+ start:2224 stop:2682 length:459 start_codon:yes stop_codon:yes gene_type:complete
MQPIYQNALPLLGYASPTEQPAEEEIPLGLLAFLAKQQEDAQGGQQQVIQSPLLSAQSGIGNDLFSLSREDMSLKNFAERAKGQPGFFGLLSGLGIFDNFMPVADSPILQYSEVNRNEPIPAVVREFLGMSDPGRLSRMDAYQAANKEETPI